MWNNYSGEWELKVLVQGRYLFFIFLDLSFPDSHIFPRDRGIWLRRMTLKWVGGLHTILIFGPGDTRNMPTKSWRCLLPGGGSPRGGELLNFQIDWYITLYEGLGNWETETWRDSFSVSKWSVYLLLTTSCTQGFQATCTLNLLKAQAPLPCFWLF